MHCWQSWTCMASKGKFCLRNNEFSYHGLTHAHARHIYRHWQQSNLSLHNKCSLQRNHSQKAILVKHSTSTTKWPIRTLVNVYTASAACPIGKYTCYNIHTWKGITATAHAFFMRKSPLVYPPAISPVHQYGGESNMAILHSLIAQNEHARSLTEPVYRTLFAMSIRSSWIESGKQHLRRWCNIRILCLYVTSSPSSPGPFPGSHQFTPKLSRHNC